MQSNVQMTEQLSLLDARGVFYENISSQISQFLFGTAGTSRMCQNKLEGQA